MDKVTLKLQVFFEDPFWIGIVERVEGNRLTASKITFGAEPKDYEVNRFLLESYYKLRFSPSIDYELEVKEKMNPKRLQREAKKQVLNAGLGTKSQQALKLQQEQEKLEHKKRSREQIEAEKDYQYELKQQKRKEKHRGR